MAKSVQERQDAYIARVRDDRSDLKQLYALLAKYSAKFKNDLSEDDRNLLKKVEVKMTEARFK